MGGEYLVHEVICDGMATLVVSKEASVVASTLAAEIRSGPQ
jgi:hypothetical protein